jgi:hypothetical protein
LIAAGDNPDRLHSDAAFAALCGVSPVPAGSGHTRPLRHRLNTGGNPPTGGKYFVAIGLAPPPGKRGASPPPQS